MVAFVVANLFGLVRQVIINRTFGTSADLDAYFAAFRVPDLIFNVIAGGALGSAFIPTFTGLLIADNKREAWRLVASLINMLLVLVTAIALITGLLAPVLIRNLLAPGFSAEQVALTSALMRIMLLSTVIFGVSGLLMGVHHAHKHFLVPAVAPILYNLGIIGGAVLLTPRWGVHGLAWGVVLGALGHIGIQVPRLLRYDWRFVLELGLRNEHVREAGRLMLPRMFGLAVWQINFWVNIAIASRLPVGSISGLTIAFQIFTFPQAVIAQAIATAVFPTLSEQAARNDKIAMRGTLGSSLRGVLYLAIPATVGLILLGRPIIALLFQNQTFTEHSTDLVNWALGWYALGLVSHSVVEIVTRAFYALKDTRTPVAIGVGAMILNVVLSLTLTTVFANFGSLPHGGLALANTLATTVELIVLLILLRPRLAGLSSGGVGSSIAHTLFGALGMGLVLLGWLAIAPQSTIVISVAGIALGGGVFWGLTFLSGSPEARQIPALALSRLRR